MDSENESSKETVGEHQEAGDWVSWEFKRQRPDKVPGCQDVASLLHLQEGESSCGEGQHCFYFSCGKCSSLLALETLNPDYKNRMQYVPRISCIPAPEAFTEDNRYHGEIHEMYRRYFAQISDLRGVAINGWNNKNAKKLFSNVDDTFRSWEKKQKTKDFEIDWILFNGATITVIEVMERSKTSTKDNGNSFKRKLEQIKKDRIIIQHLLEVCDCQSTRVNYVIACTNVSITKVTDGIFLKNHTRFFEKITDEGNTLGFIADECMLTADVYIYKKNTLNVEKRSFNEIIGGFDSASQTSLWKRDYSWMTSSVILSVLVVGNIIDSYSEHLLPGGCNFELKQNRKMTRNLCRDLPAEARRNFPELLVMGPEELEIIRESDDHSRCVLVGEAGCGKTFILLYMLYKNTSKHLSESDCKKVVFVIPQEKTELRTFVEKFIHENCNKDYVEVISVWSYRKNLINTFGKVEIILFDEFYSNFIPETFRNLANLDCRIVVALGLFDGEKFASDPYSIFPKWKLFHLRSCYRNPATISFHCMKIRQVAHQNDSIRFLNSSRLSMALGGGLKINDIDSIQISAYSEQKFAVICAEIWLEKRTALLVTDRTDLIDVKVFQHTHIINFSKFEGYRKGLVQKLSFTGVQYHMVVIVFGNLYTTEVISTLLYHSISRCLYQVFILSDEPEYFISLLRESPADLKVLDKLRRHQEVSRDDMKLLHGKGEWGEALKITILTKNTNMLNRLIEVILNENIDTISEKSQKNLIRLVFALFPFHATGEILDVLFEFRHQFSSWQLFWAYIDSANFLSALPNITDRRKLLPKLKEMIQERFDNEKFFTEAQCWKKSQCHTHFIVVACIVWGDEDMFLQFLSFTAETISSFLQDLARFLNAQSPETIMPTVEFNNELSVEKLFNWKPLKQYFRNRSTLNEEGSMILNRTEIYKKWRASLQIETLAEKVFSEGETFKFNCQKAFHVFFKSFFNFFPASADECKHLKHEVFKNHAIEKVHTEEAEILQDLSHVFALSASSQSDESMVIQLLVKLFGKIYANQFNI